MKKQLLICLYIMSSSSFCFGSDTETTFEFLQKFHADPAHMMERLPSIVDENGIAHTRPFLDRTNENWKKTIGLRMKAREAIFSNLGSANTSLSTPAISLQIIEPGPILNNPAEMEQQHLTKAMISPIPWADSYWPIYQGVLSNRYADPSAPHSSSWQSNFDYYQSNPPSTVVSSNDQTQIDRLSPAEKYDVLLGDMNFTLSNYSWRQGQYYINSNVSIPTWMGICHGWAGASSMNVNIPKQSIKVQSADGTNVTLYPGDIKALESMLWANGIKPNRVEGTRCNQPNPAVDSNGRIVDPACFDVNPSDWHEAVVNQMGIYRRSFVIDGDYEIEVWNFPLVAYSYRYFNPQTWQMAATLSSAIIPKSSFTVDKFSKYRSPLAQYVVGIEMDITYVVEIQPSISESLSPPMKTVRYMYDLELDANQNIIGTGEWYQNTHPDFLWTFDKGSQALAAEDGNLTSTSWDGTGPVPNEWTRSAQGASSRGIPLQSFLSKLTQ